MAKFCPLFSGSSGNVTHIGTPDGGILVDIGVSAARTRKALEEKEIDISSIKAIFITHSHTDHICGAKVFAQREGIPVYLTEGTLDGIKRAGFFSEKIDYRIIGDEAVELDFARVENFSTSHDCEGSCGYVIDTGERKIAVCTDLGVVTDEVYNAISGCDLVMIESNHDIKMLQENTYYPFQLKQRIMSDKGHLSNNACAQNSAKLLQSGTTRFVLAHLSRENNLPTIALETTRTQLSLLGAQENSDYKIAVASPFDNRTIIL